MRLSTGEYVDFWPRPPMLRTLGAADGFMHFRLHRLLRGEYITTVYCPAWMRVRRVAQDLEVSVMPELESTEYTERRYYRLFWGDIELKEEERFSHYVEAHGMPTGTPGMPIGTPVDLQVYVSHSPRPE